MRFPRLDFAGARHHVMNRGARREPVFLDDDCRSLFLDVLSELPERFGVRVHGFALMPNHYHLMLESVTGDLPRAMRHLGGSYSQRLNRLHSWDGPLFRGRYHNRLVGTDAYWRHLLVYLHLNPERAGFADADAIRWTSHGAYLGLTPPPAWLETSELKGIFGSRTAYLAYYNRIRGGQEGPPDDFDAAKLWAPNSTAPVAVPDFREPFLALSDALDAVSQVCGLPVEQVITAPVGRHGNPANWLAAWWLSRGCGISHARIANAFGATCGTVSKRISRVDARLGLDEQLTAWVAALRLAKGERGCT